MPHAQSISVDDANAEPAGDDYPDNCYRGGTVADHLVDEAAAVAETFPEFNVVVTSGPYRTYGVKYGVDFDDDTDRIWLDYYSVRPTTGKIDSIIEELHDYIEANAPNEGETPKDGED
jgi:hypothetical protein